MSQIPSSPGFYWRTGYNEDDEIVSQVVEVDHIMRDSPDLFYWVPNDIGGVYVVAETERQTQWYGPIPDAETLSELWQLVQTVEQLLDGTGKPWTDMIEALKGVFNKS